MTTLHKLNNLLQTLQLHSSLQNIIFNHTKILLEDPRNNQRFYQYSLLAGLLPLEWRTIPSPTMKATQQIQWATKLSKWYMEQGYELWKQCNTTIHEETNESNIHTILNQKIEHLYSLQTELNHKDHDIFHIPIEERYKLHEKQKRIWIETTTHTVNKCIYEHQEKMSTGQTDIRTFLNTQGNLQ